MPRKITRHALIDRAGHWLMAVSVLILMATAFLPILGFEFAWVAIHWITGLILAVLVLLHIVRSTFAKSLHSMFIGPRDVRDALSVLRWNLRRSKLPPPLPGKYSLSQKLIHHVFALVVLTAIVSGCIMLVKIDSPWWERNPYFLSDDAWGVVYVFHGLAALCLISLVIIHVYFALRPEKLSYLRSMVRGWLTQHEYETQHDTERWQTKQ